MNGRYHPPQPKNILSFSDIKDKTVDRSHFFKATSRHIYTYFSKAIKELSNGMWSAFAFDHLDLNDFKKAMLPVVSSGAMILVGDFASKKASQYYNETEEYDFIYKFLLASAILSFSALHRVTEKKIKSTAGYSLAVASEVMAIVYLYSSSYQATQYLLEGNLSQDYSLITGLGVSGLIIPGAMAHAVQKVQNKLVKREYAKGAQRSDTTLISSGLTGVSNAFFQGHYYLLSEMNLSRVFQLTSIAHAILHDKKWIKQFRDAPSFCVDVGPPIINEIMKQQERIDHDFKHNTTKQRVLRLTKNGPVFFSVPRYQLRNGDLVLCNNEMDLSSLPISGEVVALEQDPERLDLLPHAVTKKIGTNLIALTGENNWLQYKSSDLSNTNKEVDLHQVREGKQPAVLVGSKLNLYEGNNFFIQIKPEKERTVSSGYQKKSIIGEIVTQHKKKTVISAVLLSLVMGGIITRDMTLLPATSLRLLFNIFQMMIPFSETLLTKLVMVRLMQKLNSNLEKEPMDTISVLRVIDFCYAIAGYYPDKFPKGVAIVTDKTGTLTTPEMDVLGLWSASDKSLDSEHKLKAKELFSWIFTNQEKEFEPEEFSLKEYMAEGDENFINIEILGNNHFRKKTQINGVEKHAETWHLGLYKRAGGRFTLVESEGKKYLAFCGIPRADVFHKTSLLNDYLKMPMRTGVLSRDWCFAQTQISEEEFLQLNQAFANEDKKFIEEFIFQNNKILQSFSHECTCKINNPPKVGAEKFIQQFRQRKVPVFLATGDTASAAKNMADILYPANAGRAIVIRSEDVQHWHNKSFPCDHTIIFAGINDEILTLCKRILACDLQDQPVDITTKRS